MSTAVAEIAEKVSPQGGSKLANFRLIPRIETYPAIVSFAQTVPGKLVLLAVFGAGLSLYHEHWRQVILCLALMTFMARSRRLLLTLATVAFVFATHRNSGALTEATIAAVLVLGSFLFWCATRWPRSWFGRRPILSLLSGFTVVIVIASRIPAGSKVYSLVWIFVEFLTMYIWFIGYSLLDRSSADRDPVTLQVGTYRPFWGSTHTPYPKGAAYLRRIEARDAQQLAITQLKGLKLLAWSAIIALFYTQFKRLFHDFLSIPSLAQALDLSVKGTPLPWHLCWASVILSFFENIMAISILGHRIIACCRMAGFNALRNTYRPLSSVTVAEFFNRYYFYFKELLVDFFFYPVFFKYFKRRRNLRLTAAIFAAACFGNAFFHFTHDWRLIQGLGFWRALAGFQVYIFYSIVLATAISVSQFRHRRPAHTGFLRQRLVPVSCVVFFYCLLNVFDSTERSHSLLEHFRFLGHLFYLNF